MYGSIARFRMKPEMEERLEEFNRQAVPRIPPLSLSTSLAWTPTQTSIFGRGLATGTPQGRKGHKSLRRMADE